MAAPAAGEEMPSYRACAQCRAQKVRCIAHEADPDVCQRCARVGRACVFTPLQKRKQRKRTDTRVAELELEMRNMRSMLKSKEESKGSTTSGEAQTTAPSHRSSEDVCLERRLYPEPETKRHYTQAKRTFDPMSRSQTCPESSTDGSGSDVIDRGVLSMAYARQLVETYRRDMFPKYPVVALSTSVSADLLRHTRPALFLAVIAAASTKLDPELSAALDHEVLQTYVKRCLVQSERSLELVQSLLVSPQWYHAPPTYAQLKYYDFIRMALTMATELGMSTRQSRSYGGLGKANEDNSGRNVTCPKHYVRPAENPRDSDRSVTPRSRDSSPDTGDIESRRTFIGCYIICTTVSTSLRRPKMLRMSSYVKECVDFLKQSPDAIPTDGTLVAWARLAMIAEEITGSFSYDDLGYLAHISELRTQLMLKDFARRLTAWFVSVPEKDLTDSLTVVYYEVRLYLHEIALYEDHSPEDFKAPYRMGALHLSSGQDDNVPTAILADAVTECIECIHALLDTFLAMDVDSLRAVPVVDFIRVSYAAFVMAKLCLSASHSKSRIGNLLSRSSLEVEHYVDRLILHLRDIIGSYRCPVPFVFLALLCKVRQCCMNPTIENSPTERRGLVSSVMTLERPALAATLIRKPFEWPRFTEQSSSGSDGSSQTVAGSQAINDSGYIYGDQVAAYPQSITSGRTVPLSTPSSYDDPSESAGLAGPPAGENGLQQYPKFMSAPDQMRPDNDFIASFSDMGALIQGGTTTGLDDWMTSDLTGLGQMPEALYWYE
ncbi:hypothetical protein LTR08_005515 [Meristemomyces frigidus]|nr:hypothetical protein LTR08_005515 [Meristemomyces frigidus]